ncbi:MAG: ATP-NAD kinase [Actinobacteria bacterium]|nr:ATP-NAD kinase [Actinomycetota bacterium]
MAPKRLGLIVNPVAGLGGRVGLKGSDGPEIQRRALALGAVPRAGERAAAALKPLRPLAGAFDLLAAPGAMGESIARQAGFAPRVLPATGPAAGGVTGPEDTRAAARAMQQAGADLVLFAGGDGTARDVCDAVGTGLTVLGVPAGVKIHSAAYAVSPAAAGRLAAAYLEGDRALRREAEVIDLDEDAYRRGRIATVLHGYLMVPYRRGAVQNQKVPTPAGEEAQARAVAAEVVDRLVPGRAYLLGPGTTTRAVAARLGLPKTLVGVDVVTGGELLAADVAERDVLALLDRRPLGLILSPIGGQGFLLGRGNQQITPEVIRRVERAHLLVACPSAKLAALRGHPLLVDTGDQQVDALLAGYLEVITGYRDTAMYRVAAGGEGDENLEAS